MSGPGHTKLSLAATRYKKNPQRASTPPRRPANSDARGVRQARLQLQVPWDLSASQLVADCHRRAIECAEKARATTSNTDREFFLDMEGGWVFLARIYEFTDRRASLSNELDRHQNEREQ
jgi:hypothetical protein